MSTPVPQRRNRDTRSEAERMTDDACDVLRALMMEVRGVRATFWIHVAYHAVKRARRLEGY